MSVTAGVRQDWWYRDQDADAVSVTSPRVAASFRLTPHLAARGSVGRAFRAPTINERIRPFRAGNVLTLANADLEPERVLLGEAGLSLEGARGSLRAALFASEVEDAVTNVTLTSTPQLITRQRQNAAGVGANGAEAEGDWRLASPLWLTGTLAYTRSTYRDTPGLSGNDVPQVPRWQGSFGARWQAPSAVMVQAIVRGARRAVRGRPQHARAAPGDAGGSDRVAPGGRAAERARGRREPVRRGLRHRPNSDPDDWHAAHGAGRGQVLVLTGRHWAAALL